MRSTQHRSNNAVLAAPPGVSVEECRPLPITRVRFPDGEEGVVSFWQPSSEQLALLAAGQPVRLLVLGQTHPPLAMGVDGDGELDL